MKEMTLKALPTTLLTANEAAAKLRIERACGYEIQGGFYNTLAAFAQSAVKGVKLTIRAVGPRMSEVFGVPADLNTAGMVVTANRTLSRKEKEAISEAIKFFLNTITVQRTVKTGGKNRVELRTRSTAHYTNEQITVYGITKFVIAF